MQISFKKSVRNWKSDRGNDAVKNRQNGPNHGRKLHLRNGNYFMCFKFRPYITKKAIIINMLNTIEITPAPAKSPVSK